MATIPAMQDPARRAWRSHDAIAMLGAVLLASLATWLAAPGAHRARPRPGAEANVPVVRDVVRWVDAAGAERLAVIGPRGTRIDVYDASSGAPLRRVGTAGSAAGQFDGIAALAGGGRQLFVAERDNRRVQVLSLPRLRPLAVLQVGARLRPLDIEVRQRAGGYRLRVLADAGAGTPTRTVAMDWSPRTP